MRVVGNALAPSTNNTIWNNNIGIGPNRDPKNLVAIPNGVGISFDAASRDNKVRANVISKNRDDAIKNAANNKIFDPNSIYDNGFGIDDGTQAGAPVLTSAVASGNSVVVSGTLSSTPNTTFALEYFGGTDLDPTGSAEGMQWLGTYDVTTDASGNASINVTLSAIYGPYITATATDTSPDGGTSDFSNAITASNEASNAAVGGTVWDDTDANGLFDNSESGVSNVTVQLFTSSGCLVATTTSGANGSYLFSNVTPGAYYVRFTAPSGYFFTPPYQGDDTISSHADPSTGNTEQFTLVAGEYDPYYNAGLIPNSLSEPTTTTLDTTENPSNYGSQVTFTATVTQNDSVPLGGTVTFKDGSTVLATVNLTSDSGGYQAAYTTSALAVGNHPITATYNGDGFHSSSTASLTQTVDLPLSVTSLSSSANPALPGQSVTFTATVTGNGTPTGTVTFYDGSTELGTGTLDSNGNATYTTSTLSPGTHNISADYSGDSNFASSSDSLTQLISQETSSTMSLSSSVNPSLLDQSVTFTATVSGGSGTPTGTVTFMDGDDTLGKATLNSSGTATLTTSALSLGSQTITAIYSGDSTYNSNSASLTQTVNSPLTILSLSSNNNPAPSGAAVTFTATVSPEVSTLTPTGTVTFYDGTTEIGTGTLNSGGIAIFTTSTLALGSHDIIAEYSGDSNFDDSSDSLTQVISQENSSSVSLSSSINPSTPNQAVTFTATVSGGNGTPTGTVTFMNGDTVLGVETLDSTGTATLTTSALSLSSQTITAIYSGDATYGDSSTSLTQQVYQDITSTSVTADNNPAQLGQPVTFTAVVITDVQGTPTGTVTFLDGTTVLGTSALTQVNGQLQATFTTSTLTSGSHTITAVYNGDDTFVGSSGSMTETVGQSSGASSSVSLNSSAISSLPGQSVTFTASVSGSSGTPTGTVTFLDGTTVLGTATLDANGNATFTTSDLALGYHDITAVYSGDSIYTGSTATLSQLIDLGQTTTSLASSANPSTVGQPVTFTATVAAAGSYTQTPTGTVAFYDGTTFLGTGTLTLVSGQLQATFTTSALGLGTHNIIAIYSGDGSFANSESSLTETINS